jgi:hypothetical protein
MTFLPGPWNNCPFYIFHLFGYQLIGDDPSISSFQWEKKYIRENLYFKGKKTVFGEPGGVFRREFTARRRLFERGGGSETEPKYLGYQPASFRHPAFGGSSFFLLS